MPPVSAIRAGRVVTETVELDFRCASGLTVEVSTAQELEQVQIAVVVLDQERQQRWCRRATVTARRIMVGDRQQAADDRLDAGLGRALAELQCAEQIGPVGDRHRLRHALALATLEQRLDADSALEQRIAGAETEMDEVGVAQPAAPVRDVRAT